MKRVLASLFVVIFGVGFSAEASLQLEKEVVSFQLSNGMTWILLRRPEVPVFSGMIMVKAGGMDEPAGKSGLAHMFEHMAFKGSPDIGAQLDNEVWTVLTRNGAEDLNAFTSKDLTAYHVSLPSTKLPLWLYISSEIVMRPVMRQFVEERNVVLEERRLRYDNSPIGFAMEKFIELAYPEGPYRISPIGLPEHVKTLTEEDAYAFHRKHYTPDQMVGVMIGDVDVAAAKREIQRFWGKYPKKISKFKVQNSKFKLGTEEKKKSVVFDAEPFLLMGFHKPAPPHRDDYAFDILQSLLCGGRTGWLEKILVKEKHQATQVWCSNGFPGNRLDNLFIIGAAPAKGVSLSKLEEGVAGVLQEISSHLTEKELKIIRKQIQASFYETLESNLELAENLAMTQLLTGDWHYVVRYSDVIASFTVAELQKAAENYLKRENSVVLYREKK